MMSPDVDKQRGTDYADGGVSDLNVYYPDPQRIERINDEWNTAEGAPKVIGPG